MNQDKKAEAITEGVRFHEPLANNWSASYETGGFRRRIVFFESLLKKYVRAGDIWLDAGCGSGRLSRVIRLLGAQVVAVDGSPRMIETAKNESIGLDDNMTYTHMDTIEVLDFQSDSFDSALCSSVIEYVEQPEKAIYELFRVIRPSGILLISVPNRFSPIRLAQKLARKVCKVFGKDVFQYISVSKHAYSSDEIRRLLQKIGFVVDRVEFFDPILPDFMYSCSLGSLFVITAHKPSK